MHQRAGERSRTPVRAAPENTASPPSQPDQDFSHRGESEVILTAVLPGRLGQLSLTISLSTEALNQSLFNGVRPNLAQGR